ncbi:MAG: DUF4230 domain-containing protein [Duncaniella sp.]|nr:DUF4230 domain-containing protein [Duncaniella sp.]
MLATLLLLALVSCNGHDEERNYYAEVRSVDKLVLAQMAVTKMATIDDLKLEEADGVRQAAMAVVDALKIGNRRAAYSYSTYLRAYIDLSALTPEDVSVDERKRTITLTLPAVQTEYLGRDIAMREEHYRVTGLRSAIDAGERAAIKEKMNTALRREVEEKPFFRDRLVAEARAKASAYFGAILGGDGYTVNVEFKD